MILDTLGQVETETFDEQERIGTEGAEFEADRGQEERIRSWILARRDNLIDLTRRNPLLSLPRTAIDLPFEPDLLAALPVTDKRAKTRSVVQRGAIRLLPKPVSPVSKDDSEADGVEELPQPPTERPAEELETGVVSKQPGTLLLPPTLFRRLKTLRQRGRTSLEEQGINLLFVSLGTLEWLDPKTRTLLRSPLLLLPVELTPLTQEAGYALTRFEDDLLVNPTLRYRLGMADIQFELPEWGADRDKDKDKDKDKDRDKEISPSQYLADLAETVCRKADWRVDPAECNLGAFSYMRSIMTREIETHLDELAAKPLIRALAGYPIALEALPTIETPQRSGLDEIAPQDSYNVLPADPSQQEAVLAALRGQSFVLQGPPGTGKTQTIANMIAECIAKGKRVLFVSEKMAALEAVYKRLREYGLGPFCLEAHSHKANKREILEQLRAGQTVTPRVGKREPDYGVLQSLRTRLNQHAEALHRPCEPIGMSIYEVRGRLSSLSFSSFSSFSALSSPSSLPSLSSLSSLPSLSSSTSVPDLPFVFSAPEEVSSEDLHRLEGLIHRLSGFADLFVVADRHPWLALRASRFTAELYAHVRAAMSDLLSCVDGLPNSVESLSRACGLDPRPDRPCSPADARTIMAVAQLLEATPHPVREWLQAPETHVQELRVLATDTRNRVRLYQERSARLLSNWHEEVFALPHSDLIVRLTDRHAPLLLPALTANWADTPDGRCREIIEALDTLFRATENLVGVATLLTGLSGLPTTETLGACRFLRQVIGPATEDLKPQPDWFEVGSMDSRMELLRTAEAHQNTVREAKSALDTVYGPAFYALDLDILQPRFANDYGNLLRYFKPGYWRDHKAIQQTLLPGANLSGRDLVLDLDRGRRRRDAERWLEERRGELRQAFGVHFREFETDWQALSATLQKVGETVRALGTVPVALRTIMVASGAALVGLRDQYGLFAQRLQEFEGAVERATVLLNLPEFGSRPVTQLPFRQISAWCPAVVGALHDLMAARTRLRSASVGVLPTASRTVQDLVEAEHLVAIRAALEAESEALRRRYAHFFAGIETNWDGILAALDWTERFQTLFGDAFETTRLPERTLSIAESGSPALLDQIEQLRLAVERQEQQWHQVWSEIDALFLPDLLPAVSNGLPIREGTYLEQSDFAVERLEVLGEMERWLAFRQLREECYQAGLLSFYEVVVRRNVPATALLPGFQKGFYLRWLDAMSVRSPEIGRMRGEEVERLRAELVQLEGERLAHNPGRIQQLAQSRQPMMLPRDIGESATLKRLLNMKRPPASVRRILADIPNLLLRITPCLMMSPLSVSLFLDPDRIRFDLVIFDEASQVLVESALGALLRADQAVIAGDTQQLPPTSFFKSLQLESTEDDEDEGETNQFASILSASAAVATDPQRFPERNLTWHYRSRHESLIAFSRQRFYDRLETFPSATRPSALRFVHVPDGVYYGGEGQSRNNPREAVRVVDLLLEQLETDRTLSVGIIALSEAQQNAILDEIDRRRPDLEPALATLLSEEATVEQKEPLFVKNLENVQGDERDVILLSVGYGRNPEGKMYQRFGPINSEGGEKRLNVAVTRARTRCITVASILPEEIVAPSEKGAGVRYLREYLHMAREGAAISGAVGNATSVRDTLVESIAQQLELRNHTVHRHVGMFDYRIDLAIVDPADPESYLLGIECDGVCYDSGPPAYARDVLRPQVLRQLGWRLLRVWSADWVRDPDAILTRIDAAIQRAKAGEEEVRPAPPGGDEPEGGVEEGKEEGKGEEGEGNDISGGTVNKPKPSKPSKPSSLLPPLPGLTYFERVRIGTTVAQEVLYGDTSENVRQRKRLILRMVATEGPVPETQIAGFLARAAGFQQAGSRIQKIAQNTVDQLVQSNEIERIPEGDQIFLHDTATKATPARVPRPGEDPRPIEQISVREIAEVVLVLTKSAIGISYDEAIQETARIMGYDRTGSAMRDKITQAISLLELDGRIHIQGGHLAVL